MAAPNTSWPNWQPEPGRIQPPMKPRSFMLVAGEASGDLLAAELAAALRAREPDAVLFGAGGPRMAAAGVELVRDMSRLSVVGITDVLARIFELRR